MKHFARSALFGTLITTSAFAPTMAAPAPGMSAAKFSREEGFDEISARDFWDFLFGASTPSDASRTVPSLVVTESKVYGTVQNLDGLAGIPPSYTEPSNSNISPTETSSLSLTSYTLSIDGFVSPASAVIDNVSSLLLNEPTATPSLAVGDSGSSILVPSGDNIFPPLSAVNPSTSSLPVDTSASQTLVPNGPFVPPLPIEPTETLPLSDTMLATPTEDIAAPSITVESTVPPSIPENGLDIPMSLPSDVLPASNPDAFPTPSIASSDLGFTAEVTVA